MNARKPSCQRWWPIRHHTPAGLTLIELITTLAVATLLLAIATPSLTQMVHSSALKSTTWDFYHVLALTRQEALTRGEQVCLCPSSDGQSCNNPAESWSQGWILFPDPDGSFQRETDEPLLRIETGPPAPISLATGSNFKKGLAYLPTGSSFGEGGLGNGTFNLCDSRGKERGFAIILNATGRARIRQGASSCP